MPTTPEIIIASALLSALWIWSARRLLRGGRFHGITAYCYAVGSLPIVLMSLLITLLFLVKVAPGLFLWLEGGEDATVHMHLQAIFVVPFILPVPLGVFWAWRQMLIALERWLQSRHPH